MIWVCHLSSAHHESDVRILHKDRYRGRLDEGRTFIGKLENDSS